MHYRVFFRFDNMDEFDAFGFGHGIFLLLNMGEKIHCHLGHTYSGGDGISWKVPLKDGMLRVQFHLNKSCIVSDINIDNFEEIFQQHGLFVEGSLGQGDVGFQIGKGNSGDVAGSFGQDDFLSQMAFAVQYHLNIAIAGLDFLVKGL